MFIYNQIPASTVPDNLHRTDLRSVFHLYQSAHPQSVRLLLSIFTWTLLHFVHMCFVLISLPLFFTSQEGKVHYQYVSVLTLHT